MRFLDLGGLDPVQTQTLHQVLARSVTADSTPILAIMHANRPAVCVGQRVDITRDVDLDYCAARGIPVLRRQVGVGPLYLDQDQLLFELVLPEDLAPASLEQACARFLLPPMDVFRRLGLEPVSTGPGDISIAGRRVAGIDMAKVEQAVVLVGTILLDVDYELMARVVGAPTPTFREELERDLRDGIIGLRQALSRPLSHGEAAWLLVGGFATCLEAEPRTDRLTRAEEADWDRVVAKTFAAQAGCGCAVSK
ncbi:MAG: lipoate--protein ligase family protein [Chloroflexota bacterium]